MDAGSRIAKRLRLRREYSSAKADDSPTESKKHHHHHRRHSSGGRNAFTLYDVMSQVNQAFGKVPEAPATAETTPTAPPKTSGQSETSLHCKNAEKYAKASIDLLSTLAQNFTNMMDPFAAAFEAPAQRPESTSAAASASVPAPASAPPAPAPRPVATTEVTLEDVAMKLATEAAKDAAQEQAKQPQEPRTIHVTLGPEGFTVVTPTQTPPMTTAESEQAAGTSMDVEMGSSSSSSEPKEQQKELSRDWTLVDVDDLAEEIRAAASIASAELDAQTILKPVAETVSDASVKAPAHGGAIPKSVSFEKKDKPTPDYEELSRALRSHIEEFQQIFKPKEDLQSKKTQTPPESVAVVSPTPSVSQPAVVVPHPGK